jgi:protein-tyrosine phosphatase
MLSQVRETSVLKHRQGSVLTRGLVLKTDVFAGMRRPDLGVLLQGAPNFRQADVTGLQVYGVAQPTVTGLKTILSVLQCAPLPVEEGRGRDLALPLRGSSSSSERALSSSPSRGIKGRRAQRDRTARRSSNTADTARKRCVWACTRDEPVVYVGGRPFVLREAERPWESFQLSERADNLEAIEERLKADILREAIRYGGLLMVHEEDEKGNLRPAWIIVGAEEVKTMREVWQDLKDAGWRCDYHRIPISEDQPMENNYLDAYTQIIKEIDPLNTAFVANCGLGIRRTSFAMVAAVLVRRRQMMLMGYHDPLQVSQVLYQSDSVKSRNNSVATIHQQDVATRSLQAASQLQSQEQSTLQVIKALGKSLRNVGGAQAAVEVLIDQPLLLNALRSAKNGDYGVIGQLVGLLDNGAQNKQAVDLAIDACAHVIHLRHSILEGRISYAVAAPDKGPHQASSSTGFLRSAVHALEQYYFLITFASYVEGSETAIFEHRFATWLRNRGEIWHTIAKIRSKGEQLYFFEPIADLSALSRSATNQDARGMGTVIRRDDTDPHMVPGDEFAEHVVRHRSGLVLRPHMLLKEDIWRTSDRHAGKLGVRGALNFRRIPHTNIFATGQPTVEGVYNILRMVKSDMWSDSSRGPLQVTFINLREEPLCLVNGKPYCLRQKSMSLRNIKSYAGISWSRLALLEDRLKNDVLTELVNGDGRLLLHTETPEGGIIPIWEETSPEDVQTLQEVMSHITRQLDERSLPELDGTRNDVEQEVVDLQNVHLIYRRQPITAEKPPHFEDIASLTRAVIRSETQSNACLVLNCQLGRGRSTLISILALLVSRWLQKYTKDAKQSAAKEDVSLQRSHGTQSRPPFSYHLINSLLRVIPHGLEVKKTVDDAVDQCAGVVNLREAIEDARIAAEQTDDPEVRAQKIQSGVNNFRRYFQLIVFQAYLDATPPVRLDTMPSFEEYVRDQPVLSTFWSDTEKEDLATITPLQKVDSKSAGQALNEEVEEVVSNREGSVLSSYTMLKSDMFPGLAAQALSQIEGIPNLRGVNAVLGQNAINSAPTTPWSGNVMQGQLTFFMETWGHGMPSVDGLRKGLERIGGGPNGKLEVIATSLREEAVCVINGRPHVLRLADQPFTNVETTGISTEAVERMEQSLKQDVIAEIRKYGGKILLHDETVNETTGRFELFPIWEEVKEEDVLTPKEMYEMVQREGYRVFYARVAVTDEQAPIPAVFHEMEERVLDALRRGAACVWNCQMGRGRTTTGMVIAALVSTIAQRGEELFQSMDMNASIISAFSGENDNLSNSAFLPPQTPADDSDTIDNREDTLWLQGEYRTVLQIVAILRHGKLAKRLTDSAIDRMEAVQNLRKAIYDSKVRANNADAGSGKRASLMRVYRNYLERYVYLIIFSNYLLEKAQAMIENGLVSAGQYATAVAATPRSADARLTNVDAIPDSASNTGDGASTVADGDDGRSSVMSASIVSAASTSLFAREENRRIFPTFIRWLEPRREISSILNRELE